MAIRNDGTRGAGRETAIYRVFLVIALTDKGKFRRRASRQLAMTI
jgi:hypothetical protein